jgi:hypothetical protein
VSSAQVSARFENDHLERGPYPAFQEMTAVRGAVGFANYHMRVKHWLAVLFHDVASKGEDFDLFLYRNLLVALLLSIEEKPSVTSLKAPMAVTCASSKPVFSGKPQQRLFHSLIFIEYKRECFQTIPVLQQFRFHTDVAGTKSQRQQNADADK